MSRLGGVQDKSQVPTWSLSDSAKSTCVCCVCLYHFNKPISLLWPRVELVGEAYQFVQCKITKSHGGSLPGCGELNP